MAADQFAQNLPPWLAEADIDFYAAEFARTGFRGGLNWYRNIDRNWELLAPFTGAKVTVPAGGGSQCPDYRVPAPPIVPRRCQCPAASMRQPFLSGMHFGDRAPDPRPNQQTRPVALPEHQIGVSRGLDFRVLAELVHQRGCGAPNFVIGQHYCST
jgi:hypothetical protein